MPKLGAGGALNAAFFWAGAAALDANDYIVYNRANGSLSYDVNGNAAGGVTLLAALTNKPVLDRRRLRRDLRGRRDASQRSALRPAVAPDPARQYREDLGRIQRCRRSCRHLRLRCRDDAPRPCRQLRCEPPVTISRCGSERRGRHCQPPDRPLRAWNLCAGVIGAAANNGQGGSASPGAQASPASISTRTIMANPGNGDRLHRGHRANGISTSPTTVGTGPASYFALTIYLVPPRMPRARSRLRAGLRNRPQRTWHGHRPGRRQRQHRDAGQRASIRRATRSRWPATGRTASPPD